ncbi:TetR/AcrR family transcriptional regulator [Shewanella sp. SR44-3]|uniref:TetR/AcrR family transcriptional regulator n=1 Tax=unclassified Shewanella TaxID=196818 RepID=UPI0015FAD0CE|nr:TetR/AcrR family transcriptional regulator [Shewanella sp. SR44-3]MBB1268116.1 TetR/AcrR family transcriptional regulator [Shewanella sp. SR44-3]
MINEQQKTKSRSEIKREQILHSAIELFCVQGFPNTSMDEVAKLAGVSKQTVYAHFGSKDDLFVAAIESRCIAHQLTGNLLLDPLFPEVSIRRFAQQFGEMIVSHETTAVFKTCVAQAESHPELPRLFFNAGPKHVLGLLSGFLEVLDKQGVYHFPKPHDSGVRLCLMLFGELKLRLELGLDVEDLRLTRENYIEETAQMFLRAHRI